MTEFLTDPSNDRLILFPIKYHDIWQSYKTAVSMFWTAEEITNLNLDLRDWEQKLTDNEKHYIKHILAFFASIDAILNENLVQRFIQEVQIPEARSFWGYQIFCEQVHNETYNLLIDTYINDPVEKTKILRAIDTMPVIQKKAAYVQKWQMSDRPFAERLFAFVVVEGVLFSAAFCSIFWLKSRGLMVHGLAFTNDLIARDEAGHSEFGMLLYSKLSHKLSQERVSEILREAIELETEFVTTSLPVDLIGMKADSMVQYVKFVADRTLKVMKYEPIYNVENPFNFMNTIGMELKTNFFESQVSNYQKAGVKTKDNKVFTLDADF